MSAFILIVDDEAGIREMLAYALSQAGYEACGAEDVHEAQLKIAERVPDLILLDWMLPGVSGIDYVRRLKREELTQSVPVIMLTARDDEMDKVRGLEQADDYLTKPFSPRELIARIKAVLRRSAPHLEHESIVCGDLELDQAGHRVKAKGVEVELGPTEFKLLQFFMSHPERVYSRNQLLDQVWGGNVYIEERTIDVHIRRLRKALEAQGCDGHVQTVRGAGYRFSNKV